MLYSSTSPEFSATFFDFVHAAEKILITSHMYPDEDSISAVLTMYYLLKEKFSDKYIQMVYSSNVENRFGYFKNFEKVESNIEIADILEQFDLIIFLDGAPYYRFSNHPEILRNSDIKKICIDHHRDDPENFDLALINPTPSSTAQILFKQFYDAFSTKGKVLSELFLLGILGDTLGLTVNMKMENLEVYDIVKQLMRDGEVNLENFAAQYRGYPSRVFLVIQEFIKNAEIRQQEGWPQFLCSYVTREFMVNNGFSEQEIKSGSNIFMAQYGKIMTDVSWTINAYPLVSGGVKISLRSRPGSVNVKEFVSRIGTGGGHPGAAGTNFIPNGNEQLEVQPYLQKVLDLMPGSTYDEYILH